MLPRRRRLLACAAAVSLTATLSCRAQAPPAPDGPPPPAAEAASPPDRTLRWAALPPSALVPPDAVTAEDLLVVDALFDSLTAWETDGTVVPAAAERWWADGALSTWTFVLAEGRVHSDGTPVTAADFVTSWTTAAAGAATHHLRMVRGYAELRSGARDTLSGIRALDERTLRVSLRGPWADFPSVAAHPALGPVAARAWETDEAAYRRKPAGNGPYRVAERWTGAGRLRLARVAPAPAEGAEPVAAVEFEPLDADSAAVAFQQGRVDVAELAPDALAAAAERLPSSVRPRRGPGLLRPDLPVTYLLGFDTTAAPFDAAGARRAVSLAVDRRLLAAHAFAGSARPALNLVPAGVPGGRQRTCLPCRLDRAAARSAFARAGVRRLPLSYNAGAGHEAAVARVAADIQAAGVVAELRTVAPERYLPSLRAGLGGAFRFAWALDYPTQDNALHPLFHSRETPAVGGANYAAYADPEVDRLLDRARATADDAARTALYRTVEDLVLGRDMAVVPLVRLRQRLAVGPRVTGLGVGPTGIPDLRTVELLAAPATPAP